MREGNPLEIDEARVQHEIQGRCKCRDHLDPPPPARPLAPSLPSPSFLLLAIAVMAANQSMGPTPIPTNAT